MTHSAYKAELRRQLVAAARREQARRAPRIALPRARTLAAVALAIAAALLVALALSAVDQKSNPDDRNVTKPRTEKTRPLFGGTIDRGVRYRTRALQPGLSFVAGDDRWFADVADEADALVLRHEPFSSGQQAPPRQFLSMGRVRKVIDPATAKPAPAPRDMAAWIAHHPDLRVLHRDRTTVGGRPATVLETVAAFGRPVRHGTQCERRYTSPYQPLDGPIIPCTTLVPGFEIPRGIHQRWFVVDVGGRPLTIEYEGFPAKEYHRLRPAADELVGSIRFER